MQGKVYKGMEKCINARKGLKEMEKVYKFKVRCIKGWKKCINARKSVQRDGKSI